MNAERCAVLVVDDQAQNRDLLTRRVEQLGHAVSVAVNGREALRMLREQPFDLVLLDIMMPVVSGYEVLEQMKADDALRHVPVIVISALGEEESVVRCVQLGAEDYLPKPFNVVLLRARIGASLEKKQLRDRERHALAELRAEQERSQRLLLSIFPQAIAERLKGQAGTIAEEFAEATILFADVHGFSEMSAGRSPGEVVGLLNAVFSAFDALVERHGVEKIKTIGDAYMVAGGVPRVRTDHAEAVADLALDMQQQAVHLTTGLREPLTLRIGMDVGPVVAGVIGKSKFAYDLWGKPVNRASQMESSGLPGCIQVTEALYRKLRAGYLFEERGTFYIKDDGEVTTYLLKGKRAGPR